MRIDKFLWCVRIYKTRTLATDACKSGKVLMNGDSIKPSYECKVGNEILVKQGAIRNAFRVLQFPSSRVSAKLTNEFVLNITTEEDAMRNELLMESRKENRMFEHGKPSKKDRRQIGKFKNT